MSKRYPDMECNGRDREEGEMICKGEGGPGIRWPLSERDKCGGAIVLGGGGVWTIYSRGPPPPEPEQEIVLSGKRYVIRGDILWKVLAVSSAGCLFVCGAKGGVFFKFCGLFSPLVGYLPTPIS